MNKILLNIIKELFRLRPEKYLILGIAYQNNPLEFNHRVSISKASDINRMDIIMSQLGDSVINSTLETDFSPIVLLLFREISERYHVPKDSIRSEVYYMDREDLSKVKYKSI